MLKNHSAIMIVVLTGLAGAPATQPVTGIADLESTYRDRVGAAREAYKTELAEANADLLQGLRALTSEAVKANDFASAIAIQKRIEELMQQIQSASHPIGAGNAQTVPSRCRQSDLQWTKSRT